MIAHFNRALLIKLMAVAVVALGGATFLALGYDVEAVIQQGFGLIRSAGPIAFFTGMALLPAIGAPLSFFSLTAGSVFGPQLGMTQVLALSLTAIAANIALGYALGSRVFRPPLKYMLGRMGYSLPQVATGDATELVVLLRVTPGLPFPVQNYLLGLATVPFIRYLVISCMVAFPLNAAIILFGEALLQGRGRMALIGVLLLLACLIGIHMVRKRYATMCSAREASPG